VVTVSGPSKMIFLSGVGAEDENSTGPTILHLGDPLGQGKYAVAKIKRLRLMKARAWKILSRWWYT
ncbi:MAG: hypothetical protein ACRDHZ_05870, partial [Ktedonobacteraceae bacterium]